MDLKLFSTQIATWGSPLLIQAFDKEDAEGLTRALFNVPTDVVVTAKSMDASAHKVRRSEAER